MSRVYAYSESLGESSTTGDLNYHDKLSLVFTPGDNETWLLVATWVTRVESYLNSIQSKLVRTSGTPIDLSLQRIKNQVDGNYFTNGCFSYETYGTSPGEQTYKIQYRIADNPAYNAYISDARIFAIKLGTNDKYNASLSADSHSGDTNWVDKVSLTPGVAGDYLVLACANIMGANVNHLVKAQLDVSGSSQYSIASFGTLNITSSGGYVPWTVVKKLTLTDNDVLKIQYASTSSSLTVRIRDAYLVSLYLGDFNSYYYGESESRVTTGSTSYQDKLTVTETLVDSNYLVIGTAGVDHSQTSTWVSTRTEEDGTGLNEQAYTPYPNTSRNFHYISLKYLSATPGSYTYKIQYKANTTGTSGIQDARIAILQLDDTAPIVTTDSLTNITSSSVTATGTVVSDGGSIITERGFVYGTTAFPTLADDNITVGGTTGEFSGSITGLTRATTYHVRSYAINAIGITYANGIDFDTLAEVPTVITNDATDLAETSVTGNGEVTDDGDGTISERGFAYGENENPDTGDSTLVVAGTTGVYSGSITPLTANTTYHYRAYCTNEIGTTYGIDKSFSTLSDTSYPTVTTSAVTDILDTTATANGEVVSDGGDSITQRGFVYSASPNPTTSDTKVTVAGTTGVFSKGLTSLTEDTVYHIRGFATNGNGTSYGADVIFTTLELPTVVTYLPTNIGEDSVIGNGSVTDAGNGTISERGFIYSTTSGTTGTLIIVSGTTGNFSSSITGLSRETRYFYRAFAINELGITYGNEISFFTATSGETHTDSDAGSLPETSIEEKPNPSKWSEILKILRYYLRDLDGQIFTDAELLQYFNDAMFEIASKTGPVIRVEAHYFPPEYDYSYTWDWEQDFGEGTQYQCLTINQADGWVICFPWESAYWLDVEPSQDDGYRDFHPWEICLGSGADVIRVPLHKKFHKMLLCAFDELVLDPIDEKRLSEQDAYYRTRTGLAVNYYRPDEVQNEIVVYPLPANIWDETEVYEVLGDQGGMISDESWLDLQDKGITYDVIPTDGMLIMVYQAMPDELQGWDDIPDLPPYLVKYCRYGALERSYGADTDDFIPSLRDYWALRKKIGIEAIKKWKRLSKINRDYRLGGAVSRAISRHPRLPEHYPQVT